MSWGQISPSPTQRPSNLAALTLITIVNASLACSEMCANKTNGIIVESESYGHAAFVSNFAFYAGLAKIDGNVGDSMQVLGASKNEQAHSNKLQARDKLGAKGERIKDK